MDFAEILKNRNTSKRIKFKEILKIVSSEEEIYTKYSGDEKTIFFEDYIIESEEEGLIYFGDEFNVTLRLEFKDCYFSTKNIIFISGMTCANYVTFENCYFPNGLYIDGGNFSKELRFRRIHTKDFHLTGGTFEKILLSGDGIDKTWITGGKFLEINISYIQVNDISQDLTIINNDRELGNINVRGENISAFYLGGSNGESTYNIGSLRCDEILIANFNNTGSLNFFGIEPALEIPNKTFFQIVGSNLNKAQFYRANFERFTELIIIDSFIVDCVFVGCQWSHNIRSLRGPGYSAYKDSLKNNRQIEKNEYPGIKEAYRQLKMSMNKHNDKVQEQIFYSNEMIIYNELLDWSAPWKDEFWDKLILHFSKIFSDFGQSFIRPLFFLILGHFLFFILAMIFHGFSPLHISFQHPTSQAFKQAFERYFIYINPLRRLETSLPGYLIILDLIMRIWSSYMIFNIIRASRRFIT
jgi:hypothetical protein